MTEDEERIEEDFAAQVYAYEKETGRCFFCGRVFLFCECEKDYLEEK